MFTSEIGLALWIAMQYLHERAIPKRTQFLKSKFFSKTSLYIMLLYMWVYFMCIFSKYEPDRWDFQWQANLSIHVERPHSNINYMSLTSYAGKPIYRYTIIFSTFGIVIWYVEHTLSNCDAYVRNKMKSRSSLGYIRRIASCTRHTEAPHNKCLKGRYAFIGNEQLRRDARISERRYGRSINGKRVSLEAYESPVD
jgi:hypothetical protein